MIDLDVVNRSRGQSKEDQAVIAAEGEVKKAEIRGEEKLRDAHNEVTAVLKDMENTANQIDELEKVVEAMAKNGKDVTAKEADLVMLRTKLQDSNTALDTARKKVAEIETKNATDKQKAEQALYDAQVA